MNKLIALLLCKEKHFLSTVKILLVDFYDSFTYNLAHYIEPMCASVSVIRDNELTLEEVSNYDKIILSPGPGLPQETKNMLPLINSFSGKIPILGICLGMQGIALSMGGDLVQKKSILHGKPVQIKVFNSKVLFVNVPIQFQAGLYHSWQVKLSVENSEMVTAVDEYGVIMALEIPEKMLFGVQFHPESILTENGKMILRNFIEFVPRVAF